MKSRTHQLSAGRGTYVLLGAVVLVSLFPLYWSVVAASNDQAGISKSPPDLVPGTHLLDNLRRMLDLVDMRKALVNSFVVSATVTVSVVLTPQNPTVQVALSSLAGGYVTDYPLVLAGALVGIVPILIVFAVLGRQILDGIMQGALKA